MASKILIYSPSQKIWGGGQIYIEQLCNYINQEGITCYILTAEPETFHCPTKEMPNVRSKKKRLFSAPGLAKRCRKEGFDTIILNDLSSLWLAPVFKAYGFRVVSLLHLYLQTRSQSIFGHSFAEYWLLRFSAKFCDAILSVNKNNQKVFGKENVAFIGNYVPDWFFDAPRGNMAKPYDFVIVSRLSKEKNIPLFLELLFRLNQQAPKDYTALIVGEGSEKAEIEKIIQGKDLTKSVTLQGWVERHALPAVYDLGKCFVISSYHEGFATTLLEAHARGIPAIVTYSSGFCAEFVEGYNSPTGLVFTPKSLENPSFYTSLEQLIEQYQDYQEISIQKAKLFSETNVLAPILKAALND